MQTRQVAFRFEEELLQRLDAHAERMKAQMPWTTPTRADSVRALLLDALARAESEAAATAKRK